MSTLLVTHSACLEHLTPLGHPERPDRLRAIERVLEHERFMPLAREQAPRAVAETIALCHPPEYIEQIRDAAPQEGLMRLYPGTGSISERGEHDNIVNAPLRAGDGGPEFREAFETAILPRLQEFRPDFIVISSGFDAYMRYPLANLNLSEADFGWANGKILEDADASAEGRVVSVREGGYDLEGLARSVAAHVIALMRA